MNLRKSIEKSSNYLREKPVRFIYFGIAGAIASALFFRVYQEELEKLVSSAAVSIAACLAVGLYITMGLFGYFRLTRSRRAARPSGFWFDLLLPPEESEFRFSALLDARPGWMKKHGRRRAALIFAVQSSGTIVSFWIEWVVQKSGLIKLIERFFRPG